MRPRLIADDWYAGDPRQGACAAFTASARPATLIGFAQAEEGYRLIPAEGAFTGRAFLDTGTANAGFRFDRDLDRLVPRRDQPSIVGHAGRLRAGDRGVRALRRGGGRPCLTEEIACSWTGSKTASPS